MRWAKGIIRPRWATAKSLYGRKMGLVAVIGVLLSALGYWRDEGPLNRQPPLLSHILSWLPCRAGFSSGPCLLVVATSLMLAATVMACRSSSSGTEGNSPDWGSFVEVSDSEYPTPTASIEEMERVGGFPFIFPSYLPEGMERKIVLAAWAQTVSTFDGVRKIGGPGEEVAIYPTRLDLPYISIVERMAPFPESFPRSSADVEHINIGNIEVACETHSPSNDDRLPVMQCDWLTGEIGVSILFSWDLERAIPGLITQEMRQEAMKVVESMILAPEHP